MDPVLGQPEEVHGADRPALLLLPRVRPEPRHQLQGQPERLCVVAGGEEGDGRLADEHAGHLPRSRRQTTDKRLLALPLP